MDGGVPSAAVGVSVGVLLYSFISWFLGLMLVGLLISFGEKLSYVTIHTCFTSLSTLASIIQQIHFALRWQSVQQSQFEKAIRAVSFPGLTFVGGSQTVDMTLYFIQFWCYNTMALNIFFWSIALFTSAWGFRIQWMGNLLPRVGPVSKAFSVIFPALIIGLMNAPFVLRSGTATFIISNATIFTALTTGSFLLVLILYKYMKTRRLATGGSRRGGWWASRDSKSQQSRDVGSNYVAGTTNLSTRSSIYDRALVTRFSIGFVILGFFLGAIVVFSYVSSTTNGAIVAAGRPDFSTKGAVVDILLFIPGVTASLVTFLVFGTAKSWRQYRDLLIGCCGIRNKIIERKFLRQREDGNEGVIINNNNGGRLGGGDEETGVEFVILPQLQTTPSFEERKRNEEAKQRVQMFAREIRRDSGHSRISSGDTMYRTNTAATTLVGHAQQPVRSPTIPWGLQQDAESVRISYHQRANSTPGPAEGRMQFHRPRPSFNKGSSSRFTAASQYNFGTAEMGNSTYVEDQVIQFDPVEVREERRETFRSPLTMNKPDRVYPVAPVEPERGRSSRRYTYLPTDSRP